MQGRMLVVSDTHGNRGNLQRIIDIEYPFDYLVHCGDGSDDTVQVAVPEGTEIVRVYGNMDYYRIHGVKSTAFLSISGYKFMITHGNLQKAHNDYAGLIKAGKSDNADIVLFGHTHIPYLSTDNPTLFNPGAVLNGQYGLVIVDNSLEFFHKRI